MMTDPLGICSSGVVAGASPKSCCHVLFKRLRSFAGSPCGVPGGSVGNRTIHCSAVGAEWQFCHGRHWRRGGCRGGRSGRATPRAEEVQSVQCEAPGDCRVRGWNTSGRKTQRRKTFEGDRGRWRRRWLDLCLFHAEAGLGCAGLWNSAEIRGVHHRSEEFPEGVIMCRATLFDVWPFLHFSDPPILWVSTCACLWLHVPIPVTSVTNLIRPQERHSSTWTLPSGEDGQIRPVWWTHPVRKQCYFNSQGVWQGVGTKLRRFCFIAWFQALPFFQAKLHFSKVCHTPLSSHSWLWDLLLLLCIWTKTSICSVFLKLAMKPSLSILVHLDWCNGKPQPPAPRFLLLDSPRNHPWYPTIAGEQCWFHVLPPIFHGRPLTNASLSEWCKSSLSRPPDVVASRMASDPMATGRWSVALMLWVDHSARYVEGHVHTYTKKIITNKYLYR